MDYEKLLEKNNEEMIFALQKAVRCNSEEGESFVGADGKTRPFGQGVQDALELLLAMGSDMGFNVKNVDNYGGHIEFPGTGDKIMGIIGHLDVVPAGNGWDHEPYGGEIEDGRLYGRGTTDDKGPVISCLYAMKALKEAGYQPEATIRLILGLDEETQWKGIKYYFQKEKRPDFGFTPDADFPLINGEKGMLIFDLAKKFGKSGGDGLELRSLRGGTAPNSVADHCRAVVHSGDKDKYDEIKAIASEYRERTGRRLRIRGMGKSLEIVAEGVSAHGAKPEQGLNAISIMMEFLGRLNLINEDQNDFIAFYNKYINFRLDGSLLGIDFEDEKSGRLVFNVGMAEMSREAGKFTINIRYPVSMDGEQVYEGMEELLSRYDIGVVKTEDKKPIYIDTENPLVKELLSIYRKHTGDTESEPLVIGGGTYARSTPGIVAFGALFPGDEDLMHQKNECIDLEKFKTMTKIYAEAIYRLSSGTYEGITI